MAAKTLEKDSRPEKLERRGRPVVLNPVPGWPQEFLEILGALGDDEAFERLPQTPITKVKVPFE